MPFLVLSPEDAGSKCGFGSMAHRLAIAAFRGSREAVPVYCMIENDDPAAAPATGEISLTVSAPEAGTLSLYVAGKKYGIPVKAADTAALLGDRIVDALTADETCPVSGANVDGVITLSAKSAGPWGNGITVALNQRKNEGEALPNGVSAAVTAPSGGAGLSALATNLPPAPGRGHRDNGGRVTDLGPG